ncbi:MAG: hypothetical protein K5778_00295 [Bacteroidaceae bacterium]|nr:hypothetical protein [Bacteroidaceae bacterium]
MITEQELMAVTDRKERFELSMLYMQLHGMPPYLDPLTLNDVRQIRNAVLHVTQGMDYTSMKEGSEYFNVETGDNAYKAMQELRKKQTDEMAQRQMMERMQREADKEAARTFHFSHMDTLNDADDLTVTQIVTEMVKAQACYDMMVGWLYKGILGNEIIAAKMLLEERVKKASKQELDAYNTFRRFGIFTKMRNDATERIMDRDRKLKY